jgi:type IV secretion system protein VirB4
MDSAMMSLREYRRQAETLADFLPWAALVGEGVVLNKDGSFQRTARFRSTIPTPSSPIPFRRWLIWSDANSSAKKALTSRAPTI